MFSAALLLNIFILVPVISGIVSNSAGMTAAFGPNSDASIILTCIYGAIALASVSLLALHAVNQPWAIPMTVSLFAVQITYKLATVLMIGLNSPVVVTNLFVVVVQLTVLAVFALRSGSTPG